MCLRHSVELQSDMISARACGAPSALSSFFQKPGDKVPPPFAIRVCNLAALPVLSQLPWQGAEAPAVRREDRLSWPKLEWSAYR